MLFSVASENQANTIEDVKDGQAKCRTVGQGIPACPFLLESQDLGVKERTDRNVCPT